MELLPVDQNEIYSDFYHQYLKLKSAATGSGPVVDFDWVEHLIDSTDPYTSIYRRIVDDFYREICNEISRFNEYYSDLEHWSKVLDVITDEQAKWSCLYENVDPKVILCLQFPRAIAERFIFATANLSHFANKAKLGSGWVNDLKEAHKIDFKECNRVSKDWGEYNTLKLALDEIGKSENGSPADDFRNAFAHRFPARIEYGHQIKIRFVKNDNPKNFSVEFGEQKPLTLAEVIDSSRAQIKFCLDALELFKALINEQYSYLISPKTQNPPSG